MNEPNEAVQAEQEVMQPDESEPILSLTTDRDLKAMAISAKEQAKYVREMITHALDVTEPSQWVIMGGGDDPPVYPGEAAAKRIARLFGINWHNLRIEKQEREDTKGRYYRYRAIATFTLKRTGDSIDEIGTANSRKPFFAMRGGQLLPMEEVDEDNIEKAAITNCLTRGITGLVGIRGLTLKTIPERLAKGASRVDFKDGTRRGSKKQTKEEAKKAHQIGLWLLEIHGGDRNAAMDDLERRTTWKVKERDKDGKETERTVKGKRSLETLTPKQIDFLYADLEKQIQQFHAQQTEATSSDESADKWEDDRQGG